jgi:hypothetical protein
MPMLIRTGEGRLVIGHHPDGVPNDAVALVDTFAVGEFYVRSSGIGPGELPLVLVNPSQESPYEAWREVARDKGIQKPQVVFE